MKDKCIQRWDKEEELLNSITETRDKEKEAIEGSMEFHRYADHWCSEYINNNTENGDIDLVDLVTVFKEAYVMGLKHQTDW